MGCPIGDAAVGGGEGGEGGRWTKGFEEGEGDFDGGGGEAGGGVEDVGGDGVAVGSGHGDWMGGYLNERFRMRRQLVETFICVNG